MTVSSINWLCVHTAATVIISLIVTIASSLLPTTVNSAMADI